MSGVRILVAHVGEELGLDPAGFQRLLARQVQLDVLDLDGFQILLHVGGGLVDALLQLLAGAEQGLGHAVDARGQLVHLVAAQGRQTRFQMAVLELGDGQLHALQRLADGAAHAQRQQGGDDQAGADQQQAGEQAAIAAQQRAVMRQLQLQPADQCIAVAACLLAEIQVLLQHRHEDARVVQAADPGQALRVAGWRGGEHSRADVRARVALGVEDGHRADVVLVEHLREDPLQAFVVTQVHRRSGQRRQLFGDQYAAFVELVTHLGELHPGEVGAQRDGEQGARQQREYQYAASDSYVFEHSPFPWVASPLV
ncbi:hypothetical protein SSTU70S_05989 [Stutzerimonas stutzeri]